MAKATENPHRQWNTYRKPYEHKAMRPGETSRRCVRCGREYVPNARIQKHCDDCKRKRV